MPETHRWRGLAACLLAFLFAVCAPLTVLAADSLADRINGMELAPANPQSEALTQLLEDIMDEILDDEMEPYEQVMACYDYLVATVSYGSHLSYLSTPINDAVTCRGVYNAYGEIEGFGAVALTANTGMCNAYASAFILMVRRIGLEADLAKGYTRSGGSWVYHEWAEVYIDGETYVFDPQLEQSLRRAGLASYTVFGKTYAETNRFSK